MITDSSKFVSYILRIFTSVGLIGVCLLVLYLVSGCGKTGDPIPRDNARSFAWEAVDAEIVGKCIAFTGKFSGEYRYFDGMRVEIENLQSLDDCPGCPFVPDEVTMLSTRDVGFDPDQGTIAFAYCPRNAVAYRWRLAGISLYNRLPHAVMRDRLIRRDGKKTERQEQIKPEEVQGKRNVETVLY